MMFKVFISKEAKSEMEKMPEANRKKFDELVEALSISFFPKNFDVVKLREKHFTYRARLGEFRVIYYAEIEKKGIFIFKLLRRSETTYERI